MRAELLELVATYPKDPLWRDPAFRDSAIVDHVEQVWPAALASVISSDIGRYEIRASAGTGSWTHTPWLVVLDKAVTTSVEEGFYVVYLLSKGGERLYLSLNQGCTVLQKAVGVSKAEEELRRRARIMWGRARSHAKRLRPLDMDLGVDRRAVWRARLYEAGTVAGVVYDTAHLPTDEVLRSDLEEALLLYTEAKKAGGWSAEDVLVERLHEDELEGGLEQAKRYKQHRAIERQSSHSKKVKKALGTRCMGCNFEMGEVYGAPAAGVVDAHHLIPLSALDDGAVVNFDPKKDFAVLCPNCHRAIHKMADPSDVEALRNAVAAGVLGKTMSA